MYVHVATTLLPSSGVRSFWVHGRVAKGVNTPLIEKLQWHDNYRGCLITSVLYSQRVSYLDLLRFHPWESSVNIQNTVHCYAPGVMSCL